MGFDWLQCVGLADIMVGEEPANVRMRVPPPTNNFDGRPYALTEVHR
jgi:hypothetical protein